MRVQGNSWPSPRLRSLTRAVRVRYARSPVPASSKSPRARDRAETKGQAAREAGYFLATGSSTGAGSKV
jgi:hypothetical protein